MAYGDASGTGLTLMITMKAGCDLEKGDPVRLTKQNYEVTNEPGGPVFGRCKETVKKGEAVCIQHKGVLSFRFKEPPSIGYGLWINEKGFVDWANHHNCIVLGISREHDEYVVCAAF